MNVNNVIERAERSAEPVAFKSQIGVVIVAMFLELRGNLTFADAGAGRYMTQAVFYNRFKFDQFEELDVVPEIAGDDLEDDDEPEFPELENAIEWAGDIDNVSDEEVHEYLIEIVGEDNRKRNRDTMIKKVEEFVESQDQ